MTIKDFCAPIHSTLQLHLTNTSPVSRLLHLLPCLCGHVSHNCPAPLPQLVCYCAQVSPPPSKAGAPSYPAPAYCYTPSNPNCSCAIIPLDLEFLKYKTQTPSVSKWPQGTGQHVHGAGKDRQRWGGPARCQAAELHFYQEALPRGQLPPAACLSPGLAHKPSDLILPNPPSS